MTGYYKSATIKLGNHRLKALMLLVHFTKQKSGCYINDLKAEPLIECIEGEVTEIPSEGLVLIASGAL